MNIKILDSWLRDYLKTDATPMEIAEKFSLTSASIERLEKFNNDYIYDVEVTTNRPDLMSILGIAIEASTILPQFGIKAKFEKPNFKLPDTNIRNGEEISIKNDPKLVNEIYAVIMEVTLKESPQYIKDRLEATGIRSLNNVIDITNYVMREVGHPSHVFDYDRLSTKKIIIRESRTGEKIRTLDNKEYTLLGGDIVADNGEGEIIDLLGIMGTANSVVTNETKRILFFIDNFDPFHIRKTSMSMGIRTEAAILNEKGVNPLFALNAFTRGIELFKEIANAKIISNYYHFAGPLAKPVKITTTVDKINEVIGVKIPLKKIITILESLDFTVHQKENTLEVIVPMWRNGEDMLIAEDIIEEIARIYGYDNIPNKLPPIVSSSFINLEKNEFFWEDRVKNAMMYWGFTEAYTYPMVSEDMYEGPVKEAVTIDNPLTLDFVYMRQSLIPSLLKVLRENKDHEQINIFEIANVYEKKANNLPIQTLKLAGIVKKPKASFYEVKGLVEQLLIDLGITKFVFQSIGKGGYGATISLSNNQIGEIEILSDDIINFEINFETLIKNATLKKIYKPVSKYPPIIEDLAILAPDHILIGDIIKVIKNQSPLIVNVSLLDTYQTTRTFHVVYQSEKKNLTDEEVGKIRLEILKSLKEKFGARLKE